MSDTSVTKMARRVYLIRGLSVMLDHDLAQIYGTRTKALNQAVKRNAERFPEDVSFQVAKEELEDLEAQGMSLRKRGGNFRKYYPFVFTEAGATILSIVLNTEGAVRASVSIVRAFAEARRPVGNNQDILSKVDQRLDRLESKLKEFFPMIRALSKQLENHSSREQMSPGNEDLVQPIHFLSRSAAAPGSPILDGRSRSKIASIQKAVANYYGLKLSDLTSTTRARTIVVPRQIAVYLIRKLTGISFIEIGKAFGRSEHTTVLHAYQKIVHALNTDQAIQEVIEFIQKNLDLEKL